MDIIIEKLDRVYLQRNIRQFLDLLGDVTFEYWQEEQFLKELPGKYETSLVARIKDHLVGYIISSMKDKTVHIHKFMVSSDYRSLGIGSYLQGVFEKNVINSGFKKITLTVYKSNMGAITFYLKHHYQSEGERRDSVTQQLLLNMYKAL